MPIDLVSIRMTRHEWETLRDAIADVACWHLGFQAAKPDTKGPPQLQELIDLNAKIKRYLA